MLSTAIRLKVAPDKAMSSVNSGKRSSQMINKLPFSSSVRIVNQDHRVFPQTIAQQYQSGIAYFWIKKRSRSIDKYKIIKSCTEGNLARS